MSLKHFIGIFLSFLLIYCSSPDLDDNNEEQDIQQVSTSKVLVFDNFDPDYSNPPFNDKLTIMNSEGQIENIISGFNICQTIGGNRRLTVSDDGQSVVVCEMCAINSDSKLRKYDISGNLIFTVPGFFRSACMHNNFIYVSPGNICSLGQILKIDGTGSIVAHKLIGQFDAVVDPINEVLWTVGGMIVKADLNLNELMRTDHIVWAAVSVDVNPDGSIWLAERYHRYREESRDRLLKISPAGTILKVVNYPENTDYESAIFCIRINKSNGNFWTAGFFGIKKYDPLGNEVISIDDIRAFTIAIDPFDNSVWVGGFDDVRHYSSDGLQLEVYTDGFSVDDQTWIDVAISN